MKLRKKFGLGVSLLFAAVLFTGCSQDANGIILYGTEQQINNALAKQSKDVTVTDTYSVKIVPAGEQNAMVMNKSMAQSLLEKELLRKVDEKNNTTPLSALPLIANSEGVYFAKNETTNLTIGSNKLSFQGNVIIGDGRSYADIFVIVDDSAWEQVEGDAKKVSVWGYKNDPKNEIGNYDVETEQLIHMKENETKK
ncbi:lipoprotein BA_5634 family protein [Brevibacillus sp. 179-C9.3 HS]|uniref:lipoprotein BA_5634 family protein n=1 Tax=unclassified Brevibacillus TaxID=2684853 RepID=UPI0039A2D277